VTELTIESESKHTGVDFRRNRETTVAQDPILSEPLKLMTLFTYRQSLADVSRITASLPPGLL
jgi:hypothetical protein